MKQFKGRVIVPGTCTAEALVTHRGFNTLASFQMAIMFGDKEVKCGDQNNPDIYKKPMIGKAICLPQTIGSTTGGMILYTVCSKGKQPACMLFSMPIDSLAASGAILGDVWTDSKIARHRHAWRRVPELCPDRHDRHRRRRRACHRRIRRSAPFRVGDRLPPERRFCVRFLTGSAARDKLRTANLPVWWNGRHKGLKIPRWQQRAGSSPVTGTKQGAPRVSGVLPVS